MVRGPDIKGLARFSRETDRYLTDFFSGRREEIEFIRDRVDQVAHRHARRQPNPAAGTTILITGVQGAGKTSLIEKIEADWPGPWLSKPLVVSLSSTDTSSYRDLADAFARKLPTDLIDHFRNLVSSISSGIFSIGLASPEPPPAIPETQRPVLVCIDEIQAVSKNEESEEARMLRALHQGTHGYPLIPIFAGLAHSQNVLASIGLSRIHPRSILRLGALTAGETAEAVGKFVTKRRVAGDPAGWAERIYNWSDGWPMHVTNSLQALAGELAVHVGDLGNVDIAAVKRHSASLRAEYYEQRTSGMLARCPYLLARVMGKIPDDGLDEYGVIELIEDLAELSDRRRNRLPDGVDPSEFFGLMVSQGLLQKQGLFNEFHIPIPSLRSWCAARTGNALHLAAMTGDSDLAAKRLAAGTDANARDLSGRTPLEIAEKEGWPDIANMLVEAGARSSEEQSPTQL